MDDLIISALFDPNFFKQYDTNQDWYRKNYHNLLQTHKDEMILIIDENRQEFFTDIMKLRERISHPDIDSHNVVVEYITDEIEGYGI